MIRSWLGLLCGSCNWLVTTLPPPSLPLPPPHFWNEGREGKGGGEGKGRISEWRAGIQTNYCVRGVRPWLFTPRSCVLCLGWFYTVELSVFVCVVSFTGFLLRGLSLVLCIVVSRSLLAFFGQFTCWKYLCWLCILVILTRLCSHIVINNYLHRVCSVIMSTVIHPCC